MKIEFEIDLSDLDFDINKIEKAVSEELERTALKVQRTAKELVPVDTGSLRRSITVEGNMMNFEVFANTEYAVYIEYGTSPHRIEGNPYLWWEGASHPVKSVMHTGNKAYLYMETSFNEHTDGLDTRVANAINEVL